jgi:signal transduction histidine kinase
MTPGRSPERSRTVPDLLAAVEMERRRIAQDLHDNLGQQLTGISFLHKVLHRNCSEKAPAEARDLLEAERLVQESIHHTRNLSLSLCPAVLSPHSLASSFAELASRTEATYPVRCGFRGKVVSSPLSPTRGVELLTLVQEAVFHAIRDRKAGQILIVLEQVGTRTRLTVQNDGKASPGKTDPNERIQIRIMELRAKHLGGELLVESTAAGETLISCLIPNGE